VRSCTFLEKNMEYLEAHADFVASTCPVRFEGGEFDPIQMGDETLDQADSFERILKFLETWHANGRMYSLFKTEALRNAKLTRCRYLGGDWTLMINLLFYGKFKRLDMGFVERGKKGVSNSLNIFSIYRNGIVCWFLPFFDMSVGVVKLFRNASFKQKLRLLWRLFHLNGNAFRVQIKYELQKSFLRHCRTETAA